MPNRKKLLLHCCCAPCTCYVLERLVSQYAVSILFYNPNIEPRKEYEKRKSELLLFMQKASLASKVKLLDNDGAKNPKLSTIPNDKGGIYLFLAKTHILPESHLYLMYIGRAHKTQYQNLRKRCSEYSAKTMRPKIKRMIEQWGQYLYIRYLPLDDNTKIDKIEAELINKILPPFNDEIPNKELQAVVSAFRL